MVRAELGIGRSRFSCIHALISCVVSSELPGLPEDPLRPLIRGLNLPLPKVFLNTFLIQEIGKGSFSQRY